MRRAFRVGQRVQARFDGGPWCEGVVSGETRYSTPVQFQPCGAHYGCHEVRAYGDANGWTDAEYRIERERSYCWERAETVEHERRARYPDKPFSMFQPNEARSARRARAVA